MQVTTTKPQPAKVALGIDLDFRDQQVALLIKDIEEENIDVGVVAVRVRV